MLESVDNKNIDFVKGSKFMLQMLQDMNLISLINIKAKMSENEWNKFWDIFIKD